MSKDDRPEEEFPTTPLKPIKSLSSAPKNSEEVEVVEECRTPTSGEHKIPEVRCCPPAPRKPRVNAVVSCKRTRRRLLSERLDFLPACKVSDEELDGFFRSFYEIVSAAKRKRSCE